MKLFVSKQLITLCILCLPWTACTWAMDTEILWSEDFSSGVLGDMTAVSVTSNQGWEVREYGGNPYAYCNGYGADTASDDWLFTPAIDLLSNTGVTISADLAYNYDGPELEVLFSVDYDPSVHADPNDATWTTLPAALPTQDYYVFCSTGELALEAPAGASEEDLSETYVAFHYVSTGTISGEGRIWEVDNIRIQRSDAAMQLNLNTDQDDYTTIETVTLSAVISGGTAPYRYAWDLGNGTTSIEVSPSLIYSEAGTYTVSLTVTDNEGLTATLTQEDLITVLESTSYDLPAKISSLRIATYNAYLNRTAEGELIENLSDANDTQVAKVAEIIQRVNPDVILLNEFDYDAHGTSLDLFQRNYLEVSQNGQSPVVYDFNYVGESNTGIPSGFDFNNDGRNDTADDAYGYGDFPGQYGMVILSKYPIDANVLRTFQTFRWQDMPGALLPDDLDTAEPNDWYSDEELAAFRLSSKSHWDIPVEVNGVTVHCLCSHPTPPTYDGDEDRNGKRNHDEIRLWADYVSGADYLYDDQGVYGGLDPNTCFVIMGDQNADPNDGDSTNDAIWQLLTNISVNARFAPSSLGAAEQSDDVYDTASWNLRADYVLPSVYGFDIVTGGVYWPQRTDVEYPLVKNDASSDHRLVYMDLNLWTE